MPMSRGFRVAAISCLLASPMLHAQQAAPTPFQQAVTRAMQGSHGLAQENVDQVQQAVAALERISDAVNLITEMNLQIASAAEEQSSVADEINRNVGAIRDVTESLSGQAEQSAQVSRQLNDLANHQQGLMQQFRA